LRIRGKPGLESFYTTVAKEKDVFKITDGPAELDGHIWWQVQSVANPEIMGWCAGDFLKRR
jgi:hypothetical protein